MTLYRKLDHMASEKTTSTSFSYIATNPTTGVVRGELEPPGKIVP